MVCRCHVRMLLLILACSLLTNGEPPAPVAQHSLELAAKHRQFFDWALIEAVKRAGGQQPWRADAERLSAMATMVTRAWR